MILKQRVEIRWWEERVVYEQPKQKIVRGRIEEEDLLEHFHSHRFFAGRRRRSTFSNLNKNRRWKNGKEVDGEWTGVAGIYFLQRTDVRHWGIFRRFPHEKILFQFYSRNYQLKLFSVFKVDATFQVAVTFYMRGNSVVSFLIPIPT